MNHRAAINAIALAALNEALELGADERPIATALMQEIMRQRAAIAKFVREADLGRDAMAAAIARGEAEEVQ